MSFTPGFDPLGLGYGQGGTQAGAASRLSGSLRYDVLDTSLNVGGTLTPARSGGIAVSQDGNVRRALRDLTLHPDDAADLDPARDRIRPTWVDWAGTDHPLGVYRIASAETVDRHQTTFRGKTPVSITGADESVRLIANAQRSLSFGRDLDMVTAAERLAGYLDLPSVQVAPTTDGLGEPLSWALGETSWQDVAETVAGSAGFLPPWFDNSGTWRWMLAPRPRSDPVDRVWSTSDGSVAAEGMGRTVSLLDEPNVWYGINTAAANERIVGRYELASTAPNSIANVGYEIPERVEFAGLQTQGAADNAARAAAVQHVSEAGTASLTVPFDPTLDLYELCEVDGLRYRITGWSYELNGTTMELDLIRVYLTDDPSGSLLSGLL